MNKELIIEKLAKIEILESEICEYDSKQDLQEYTDAICHNAFQIARKIDDLGSMKLTKAIVDMLNNKDSNGKWIKNIRGDHCIVCSECGYGLPTEGFCFIECNSGCDDRETACVITDVKNYCPNCGSKMQEGD